MPARWLRPRRAADGIGEELRSHIAQRADHIAAEGVPPGEALRRAHAEFGAIEAYEAQCRREHRLRVSGSGPGWGQALYWAWRNVRARGAHAGLIVGLLAIALAANTLVFAVADSMVFRKLPFWEPGRLVGFVGQNAKPDTPAGLSVSAALLDEWRRQTDIFQSVETYLTKTMFLSSGGTHETVAVADVTPGMTSLLGAKPRWGRPLELGDAAYTDAGVVLISESLARARFGAPDAAVGQTLSSTAGPLVVVGVMAESFRFPAQRQLIWRALDPRGPLTANFSGTFAIARLQPGVSIEAAAAMVAQRSAAVGEAAGHRTPYAVTVAQHHLGVVRPGDGRLLFGLLLGAALCLLAIACANVASVEIAGAIARARTSAVQLALGASRGTLARVALLEGAMLFGLAAVAGAAASYGGMQLITARLLPAALRGRTANPVDLDHRALIFMVLAASAAWVLTMLPIVLRTYRVDLLALLKLEDRSSAGSSGGARLRRALTLIEVALAVLLATTALLWARSYGTLLGADKGFETRNIASITYTLPPAFYDTVQEKRALERILLEKLAAMPGVTAVAAGAPPTGALERHADVRVLVDDLPAVAEGISLGVRHVDADYFSVLGIPLLRGRMFSSSEAPTSAIVSDTFARRYWGHAEPVGRTFRQSDNHQITTVIGVAGDLRLRPPDMQGVPPPSVDVYFARQPPPPPQSPPGIRRDTGGSYGFVSVMARFDSPERVKQVRDVAATIEPRFAVKVDLVDDEYAQQFSQVLLVTRIVGAFGVLSLLVAMFGLYGVLALLVNTRRREIGIRMALGAGRADILRLVMSSSFRLVLAGAALGAAGAIAVARASASLLYGVKPADPLALGIVMLIAIVTGLLATWRPAEQAAAIDPSTLLRS